MNTTDNLLEAITHKPLKKIEQFLDGVSDVNAQDKDGYTLLHLAISLDLPLSMVKLLLDRSADVNARDNDGYTPLHLAISLDLPLSMLKLLLDRSADVDARDKDGNTSLHLAIDPHLSLSTVKLLLDRGADVDAQDNNGNTPLHLAISRKSQSIATYLIEKGADVNTPNNDQDTPLHLAVSSLPTENIIKYLITNGADMGVRNKSNRTPLYIAIKCKNILTILLLLEGGTYSYQDWETEKALESWIQECEPLSLNPEQARYYIRINTTALLAGVQIPNEALPNWLQSVKARIEEVVGQWLSPLKLSKEQIPIVLRALPRIFKFVQQLDENASLAIRPNYDTASRMIQEQAQLQGQSMPTELRLKIFDKLIDVTMLEELMDLHPLESALMHDVWFYVKAHIKEYKAYMEFYAQLFRYNWANKYIPLPHFQTHPQHVTLNIS